MNPRAWRQDRRNGRPPWWVWFEPPRWWPEWLHLRTCTFCRGMLATIAEDKRRVNVPAAPTCQLCDGSGWIPGVARAVGPLDELPCPECAA